MTANQPSILDIWTKPRTPLIESAETSECGLACLAMVAGYHGLHIDLRTLRQRFHASLMGMRLSRLIQIADQLGLSSRALRLETNGLTQIALPAILHWDMNHFVVLTKMRSGKAVIHDPSRGARTISQSELGEHFTGIALELNKGASFAPAKLRERMSLTQLWSNASGLTSTLVQTFVLSAALQVVAFALPFELQLVVDNAIYQSDRDLLTILALGFGALLLVQVTLQFLRDKAVIIASNLFSYQLVGNVVRHLVRLPISYFERRHLGDIISRLHSTDAVRAALTQGIVSAIIDGVMATLLVIILFVYSAVLAGIVLTSIALYLAVMLFSYSFMRGRTSEQIVASAMEQTNLMEMLRAIGTIKIMGGETDREARWRNLYARLTNANLALGNIQINTQTVQSIIRGLQGIIILYIGAEMVIDGKGFSVGMLIAFLSFQQTFSDRLMSLIAQYMQFRLLRLHLDRLSDIVYSPPESIDQLPQIAEVRGDVAFKEIEFQYSRGDIPVLTNCTMEIEAGSFVAVVGPSGAGKSTLLKLMLGLYSPDSGEILLDGRRPTAASWRAWRSSVGYVAQDDRLLSGSIADNIAFFDPILEMERVISAAKAAKVHVEIEKMPMQYLSTIGDMGSALSGGQRQRILLARALYRNPKVLILDEGTANLDEQTEEAIAELVASIPITRIVVAHRAALIRRANRVLALQDGQLHEMKVMT